MTLLNSQFDVISHDPHPNARAGLLVVLPVKDAPSPYDSLPASGTPVAGDIPPGMCIAMDSDGLAVPADQDNITPPAILFITVDGDQDYDGAYVHKITCIQGGGEFQLDTNNFKVDTYSPGDVLTADDGGTGTAGRWRKAVAGEAMYAIVGPDGADTQKGTLRILIPQGWAPVHP
jgi:hypothetical protein